jgi:C-terminal processing protease CtpA/Prc
MMTLTGLGFLGVVPAHPQHDPGIERHWAAALSSAEWSMRMRAARRYIYFLEHDLRTASSVCDQGGSAMHRRWLSIDHAALFAAGLVASMLFAAPAFSQTLDVCRPRSPVRSSEGPRPLTEQGMRNAIAFTRLLGYVRYFHPSDQVVTADWDRFAIEGMRRVEPCEGPEQLASALEELFRPVAPTAQVFLKGTQPATPAGLVPPAGAVGLKVVSWRHFGVGLGNRPYSPYRSERVYVDWSGVTPGAPDSDQIFSADLGAGVSTRVPLKLYANAIGTLPATAEVLELAPEGRELSGNDRSTRLAAVALAWNVFQHFYPYFDVVETDWPHALVTALTTAATDADERAFVDTLSRLLAALHDGHGRLSHPRLVDRSHALPLAWALVEDKLVITHVVGQAADAGFKPGDVVIEVDGESIDKTLARMRTLISSATPQYMRHVLANQLRSGPDGSVVRLKVESQDGRQREGVLRRIASDAAVEPRPATIADLEHGISYVDLGRATDVDFKVALPKLAEAKVVIFDLRGYPKMFDFLAHLSDQTMLCAIWQVPISTKPDRLGVAEYDTSGRWDVPPESPRLKGRLILLIDGRAVSAAETVMGIVEAYRLADIVGEPTAGTNGNVNPFPVPGGYVLSWTGMRVLKHDGSRHHGVGILPTHPVSRTIKGITERRDEILEKALELAHAH